MHLGDGGMAGVEEFGDTRNLGPVAVVGTEQDRIIETGSLLDVARRGTIFGQRLVFISEHRNGGCYEIANVSEKSLGKVLSFVDNHVH